MTKIQFTISSENELYPSPIGIHGMKNNNREFLKFIRKLNFISFLSKIHKNVLSVRQTL